MLRRIVLTLAVAVVAVGCQPSGPGGGKDGPPPTGKGEFLATCSFSHRLNDDPIVHPGHVGMSHSHDFFGNTSVHAGSTTDSMADAPTNCSPSADRSAYWVPTLSVGGVPLAPDRVTVYYTSDLDDPRDTTALPHGLRMVAGSAKDVPRDDIGVAKWSCRGAALSGADIVTCPSGSQLELLLRFPDCWDGVHLDSVDHGSHMAYSTAGRCPPSHPVGVPRIEFKLRYPTSGAGATLSAGSGFTAHGDVWNLWDPAELQRRIVDCLHTARKCDEGGRIL
ncbi:MAG: DUF1996 domain-containing protein [Microthrixaceae bacterium]